MNPIDAAWGLLKANPRDQLFGGSPDNYAEFEENRPPVDRFGPINPAVLGLLRRRMGMNTMNPERKLSHPDMNIHGRDIEDVPTLGRTELDYLMAEGYDGALDGPRVFGKQEEPFDLREALEANTDPNSQLAIAMERARQQRNPPAPLQLRRLADAPEDMAQTQLPAQLTSGATSVGRVKQE
tara:strand:+ start:73 stop:618 length:546 start_codon:yes stop_codon:yes gene_type:complete